MCSSIKNLLEQPAKTEICKLGTIPAMNRISNASSHLVRAVRNVFVGEENAIKFIKSLSELGIVTNNER